MKFKSRRLLEHTGLESSALGYLKFFLDLSESAPTELTALLSPNPAKRACVLDETLTACHRLKI